MAKLVTKFKYLNPNRDTNIGGYVKYIATREGVEKIDDTKRLSPATGKQQQFIEKILRDFPNTKEMLEYEDYQKDKTIGNAVIQEALNLDTEKKIIEEMEETGEEKMAEDETPKRLDSGKAVRTQAVRQR